MILEEIATYLEGAGVGLIGETLALGSLPLDAPGTTWNDAVMVLIEIPGRPSVRTHDKTVVELARLQILTRGAPYGYATARLKAQDAWNALEAVTNQVLSGVRYLRIEPLRAVWWLRTDDMNRPHLLFDVECTRALP